MGDWRARAGQCMADARTYCYREVGVSIRNFAAELRAEVERTETETDTGLGPLVIDRPSCSLEFRLDFDGGAETKVVGGHMLALGEIADRHGAEVRPMRLEPEHPAEGEPFTMILTYHFTEGG